MKHEEDYMDLCNEIQTAANKADLDYLIDIDVNRQDAEFAYGQDNYYEVMCDCAIMFAVNRCEGQYNISLNDLLGRVVY
tara:strand:+ start:912 stop:1148 length:237 start_codon:yes stop_codon:yes gene_type:complete